MLDLAFGLTDTYVCVAPPLRLARLQRFPAPPLLDSTRRQLSLAAAGALSRSLHVHTSFSRGWRSRLGCQVKVTAEMDGIELTIPDDM
jgi:hypothetical protein